MSDKDTIYHDGKSYSLLTKSGLPLSRRDYFAMAAMQALVSNQNQMELLAEVAQERMEYEELAVGVAVLLADALIKQLDREKDDD